MKEKELLSRHFKNKDTPKKLLEEVAQTFYDDPFKLKRFWYRGTIVQNNPLETEDILKMWPNVLHAIGDYEYAINYPKHIYENQEACIQMIDLTKVPRNYWISKDKNQLSFNKIPTNSYKTVTATQLGLGPGKKINYSNKLNEKITEYLINFLSL